MYSVLALVAWIVTQPPAATPVDPLAVQVALDRAGFSPGTIDGQMGRNTERALEHYRKHRGALTLDPPDPLTRYAITEEDVKQPFAPEIPSDLMAQSELPALAYTSVVEALAERFHTTPALLRRLNREATFTAGEEILVPNVDPMVVPVERLTPPRPTDAATVPTASRRGGTAKDATPVEKPEVVVTVSKAAAALTITDAAGQLLFYAPVTTGSDHDPLPIGEWKVRSVHANPQFHYNPDLFWDADPTHSKATIQPGPNNPVGLVWIDLSKEHYGIHGTPQPETIGRTASHGCVRLANWNALKVAGMVKPGTRVVFTE